MEKKCDKLDIFQSSILLNINKNVEDILEDLDLTQIKFDIFPRLVLGL
jgi:hypothetical protein